MAKRKRKPGRPRKRLYRGKRWRVEQKAKQVRKYVREAKRRFGRDSNRVKKSDDMRRQFYTKERGYKRVMGQWSTKGVKGKDLETLEQYLDSILSDENINTDKWEAKTKARREEILKNEWATEDNVDEVMHMMDDEIIPMLLELGIPYDAIIEIADGADDLGLTDEDFNKLIKDFFDEEIPASDFLDFAEGWLERKRERGDDYIDVSMYGSDEDDFGY